jgi:2-phospho-L-lactate/phosphoenolpyruvate guanylyltransferase
MWAVVPLKSPHAAKSRLAGVLQAEARARLFFALAEHVIATLRATPGIERVLAVSASSEAGAFARSHGADVLRLASDAGTGQACRDALEALRPRKLRAVLMIAADLPLLTPFALSALLASARRAPCVALAPDRKRAGTNALLCSPPEAIPAMFGAHSFERHASAARRAGVALHVIESKALAFDVDDAADLQELRALLGETDSALGKLLRELRTEGEEALAS